jgi:hypothetical protein
MGYNNNFKEYTTSEIEGIIDLYLKGTSFSKIGVLLKRQKNTIKKILIENDVWVENRDRLVKNFNDKEIIKILSLYNDGIGCTKIGKLFNISGGPIKKLLKEYGVLRKGYSDGNKINLTENEKNIIKKMYLTELKNSESISKELGFTKSFIDKYLSNSGYRRTKGEAISLVRKGKKLPLKTRINMKKAQIKLAKSGKRKQTGGYCKFFKIHGLNCQGTYEKRYIEMLFENNMLLPKDGKSINTPFGVYYPDFEYLNTIIEIKSSYTYDVLYGVKANRWNNKVDLSQLNKIEWVNKNIKPVDIIVMDKRAKKIIKKYKL